MTLLRTESFVPLTTAPTPVENREFRVTVIPEPAQARPFKSLEPTTSAPAGSAAHPEKICEPRVSIQRDGDRITSLRIQCTCGQIMDLACIYETSAKPA